MIIWLASYPRSGNTLVRTMLYRVFGYKTYSIYDDLNDIGAIDQITERVGHEFLGMDWSKFYTENKDASRIVFVKTHGHPIDDNPAIYIVRDGRSAIVSWLNMLRTLRGRKEISIEDLIVGRNVDFGDWSSHVRAWTPTERPSTLLLRYDELLSGETSMLDRIASFIATPPRTCWENEFSELHRLLPHFFNRASDERNIEQMSDGDLSLFWRLHGACMRELGFEA